MATSSIPLTSRRTVQQALAAAIAAHQAGRMPDAERGYREILRVNTRNDAALHGMGLVAQQSGDLAGAVHWMRAAIGADPAAGVYRSNLGNVLQMQGLLEEAIAEYRIALTLRPDSAAAWSNLGAALLALGRVEEAVAPLGRAAELRPELAQIQDNLGNALQGVGRVEEAVARHERALRLRPDHAETHGNLGLAQAGLGRWDAAMASFERAVAMDPGNARVQLARAQLQLLTGQWELGWANYEWRKRVHGERRLAGRTWSGEAVTAGETLLLYAEQGLGDTIQFLRYVPAARQRMGAEGGILVEVQEPMLRLAAEMSLAAGARVVPAGHALPRYDWHCSLMSLPLAPGMTEISGEMPYLKAPEAARRWAAHTFGTRAPASTARLRVGLVWAGNPGHVRDRFRSIPASVLTPLLAVDGVEFLSLQMGGEAEAAALRLPSWTAGIADLADTAALIERLDLVLGVDTAVVHLAGALGKPVWTILPFWPDWRWGLEGRDSLWYPSMRLFRQSRPGDWAGVVETVRGELAQLAAMRGSQ